LGFGLTLATAGTAFSAGDFYVATGGLDTNACTQVSPCATISRAISVAGASGTIHVGPGSFADNISVSSGTYTVIGDSPSTTTISAAVNQDLVDVGGSANLTLQELTLHNTAPNGVQVFQTGGTFALNQANVTGHYGLNQYGGTTTLSDDTISTDYVGFRTFAGSASIEDSTIVYNGTGGVAALGGTVVVIDSTITSNGVYGLGTSGSTTSIAGSILAANGTNCAGAVTDDGYNLSTDNSCGFSPPSEDNVTGAQLSLGPLANNGGPTLTELPLAGSIAIDAVPTSNSTLCTGTDQRGIGRPQGAGCDIGAVEVAVVDNDLALSGLPSDITVNATGPSGANVNYSVTATDEETPPSVSCNPAPGVYPIGTTTVTCSATDDDDSPTTVTGSFTITVQGAAAQLSALRTLVTGLGPGQALSNQVQATLNDVSSNHVPAACTQLGGVINLASAQSGKKLTVSQAMQIITSATQIKTLLGC
jgi:hypothetical protein